MAIVDSLKKLLTRFGGDVSALEENATSSDVIDAISEAYTDKEGTYTEVSPIVTEGTKIATITTNNVDHDIYAPEAVSNIFRFNITYEYDSSADVSLFKSDKTYSEIKSAFDAGKSVIAYLNTDSYPGTDISNNINIASTSIIQCGNSDKAIVIDFTINYNQGNPVAYEDFRVMLDSYNRIFISKSQRNWTSEYYHPS